MMKILFLLVFSYSSLVYAQADYIPPQAFQHRETIKTELNTYFPNIPDYNYVPSLIEHESCITLRHKKCWNSASQLKTSRELGVGLGQITKTYREDGSIRFDKLTELRDMYKIELKDAKWETIHQKPDVQIRMIVLMLRDDYKRLYNVENVEYRLQMTDAAYNGGIGGLLKERRACGLSKSCDPGIWFNNVENFCLKSKKVLYGNRSICTINRYHVYDIWEKRLPKYRKYYF